LASRYPVHVTMKLRKGMPSLRRRRESRLLFGVFAKSCERPGFRLLQFSVQRDHLHLIVEAKDRGALSRGLQGLAIRVAKGLNRLWQRVVRDVSSGPVAEAHGWLLRRSWRRHGLLVPWEVPGPSPR